MENIWNKFAEYGLIGIFCGVVLFILWRMIIWVMSFVKEQSIQHTNERICWQKTMDRYNEIASQIATAIQRHDEKADERGKYVREEHKQMIEALGRINGYKR